MPELIRTSCPVLRTTISLFAKSKRLHFMFQSMRLLSFVANIGGCAITKPIGLMFYSLVQFPDFILAPIRSHSRLSICVFFLPNKDFSFALFFRYLSFIWRVATDCRVALYAAFLASVAS
ncbi:uncharacterized protein LOC131995008 [Stomoxys calcitrans]|uniref:uncharacterized protein LOC131995008 n=1 Tax=Stomoxys calcitrans TaxID=35570 RepID=UPI0027E2B9F1|nr:uncharacterized protein LOC131995008 [Stomoxys calcitrans]